MAFARLFATLTALMILASACGSNAGSAETSSASADEPSATPEPATAEPTPNTQPVSIPNHGGSLEGHTPRGFQGMGTGLFAGDELNSNFPQDDGVQIWLTFELPADLGQFNGATLRSDALTVRGNPFETLGDLQVAPVRYDEFGPSVVPLEPVGDTVTCPTPTDNRFSCDVSAAVQAEVDAGQAQVQLRLRFEGVSDPDGEQDMALFFLTDSNTNEPGIFHLDLG